MFINIIINGIQNGKSNEEIIAEIEMSCKTSISGSSMDFIVEDIEWYRSNPIYNTPIFSDESFARPFKTDSFQVLTNQK